MVLVASAAFNTALTDHKHLAPLVVGAISAGILAFCLWWLYFGFLGEYDLTRIRTAFIWGYGHYLIYGSLTAIGGTLAALLEQVAQGNGALGPTAMALTLTIPVAIFLATIALLRSVSEWATCYRWLLAAALVLLIGTTAGAAWGATATLVSVCVATAAFLTSEIVTKWKAAVRRRQNQGAA
jgi:hypothetical protein